MTDPFTALIIGHVSLLQAQILGTLTAYDGDPHAASDDPELFHAWDYCEPEPRAALLLSTAWETRTGTPPPENNSHASAYAADLHKYARQHTGTPAEFTGPNWPAMPLPGSAGALASSLAFDRDDTPISLLTVLLLLTTTETGQPS